jgi:hypothetical protein
MIVSFYLFIPICDLDNDKQPFSTSLIQYNSKAGASRSRKRQQIKAAIKGKHKRTYWLALRRQGNSEKRTDEIVALESKKLQWKLLQLDIPSPAETRKALRNASNEVKYVFGVLGLNPNTFVTLVNELGFEKLQDLFDVYDILEDCFDEWEVQRGTGSTLEHFCRWYDDFVYIHGREPQVIGPEFNDSVWQNHAFCPDVPVYTTRRIQPKRTCKKEALQYQWGNHMQYTSYSYLNYQQMDLISIARKETEIQFRDTRN